MSEVIHLIPINLLIFSRTLNSLLYIYLSLLIFDKDLLTATLELLDESNQLQIGIILHKTVITCRLEFLIITDTSDSLKKKLIKLRYKILRLLR